MLTCGQLCCLWQEAGDNCGACGCQVKLGGGRVGVDMIDDSYDGGLMIGFQDTQYSFALQVLGP